MTAVRLAARAASAAALQLDIVDAAPPARVPDGQALVRVEAAAVNPSDVKAALGLMPQAVFPRTPGRDFGGTVVDGPADWVGRDVWGSGGDIGITRDGSHAGWLLLPVAALQRKPTRLSFAEAGSVGVPFVTAYEGLRRAGNVQRGQQVAVFGANGKVGQAAVQLALQAGAGVFAVQRGGAGSSAGSGAMLVDAAHGDVADRLRALTAGRGIDIAFNTVGSPYFDTANRAMAKGATQILISTVERPVPFDIFAFYRGMHTLVGIDTLAFDAVASGQLLAALHDGFDAGTLRPFALQTLPLADAADAYRRVVGGESTRLVLLPR